LADRRHSAWCVSPNAAAALCGYAIREGESDKGEAILINMKPKS
jgi:hypothetical protein